MRVVGYQLLLQKRLQKNASTFHNKDFLEKTKEFDMKSQRVDE